MGAVPAGRPDPGEAIISIQGITKRFGGHTVLDDITFDIPRGETSAVLGPSGTGKSVLLKVVIGLLSPDAGQVYIDGDPIVGVREKEVLRIRRKIGVLFQDGALFGSMNLFDNIAFPLVEHTNKTDREVRNTVLRKSELVGLVDHLHKLPGEVSGGMRKRAGLARALVLEPRILFFDEPDSGLDPVRVAYLDDLINTVHEETGATFFIISHNIESVKRTAHHLGLLFRTKLVGFGPKDEMINSTVPVIEQFLAGRPEGPIGMDEMADEVGDGAPANGPVDPVSRQTAFDTASLSPSTLRPGIGEDPDLYPDDPGLSPEDPGGSVEGEEHVTTVVQGQSR